MLVRMLVSMEGPGVSRQRGEEIEVDDREAARLIAAGYAAPVREAQDVERAVKTPRRRKGR